MILLTALICGSHGFAKCRVPSIAYISEWPKSAGQWPVRKCHYEIRRRWYDRGQLSRFQQWLCKQLWKLDAERRIHWSNHDCSSAVELVAPSQHIFTKIKYGHSLCHITLGLLKTSPHTQLPT